MPATYDYAIVSFGIPRTAQQPGPAEVHDRPPAVERHGGPHASDVAKPGILNGRPHARRAGIS